MTGNAPRPLKANARKEHQIARPGAYDAGNSAREEQAVSKHHLSGLETKRQPLLSHRAFAGRLVRSFGASAAFIGFSLLVGMAGYHWLEGLSWLDAYANAAMILSGMGPLGAP